MKPRIFIASAGKSLDVAYAAQEAIEDVCEPTVWTQGVFLPSQTTITAVIDALGKHDFGLFVATPDDLIDINGSTASATRDNVIFELGVSVGLLGIARSFILRPRSEIPFRLPTDLLGITVADYSAERSDGNLSAALGPAVNKIRKAITTHGKRHELHQTNIAPVPSAVVPPNAISIPVLFGASIDSMRERHCGVHSYCTPWAYLKQIRDFNSDPIEEWQRPRKSRGGTAQVEIHRTSSGDYYLIGCCTKVEFEGFLNARGEGVSLTLAVEPTGLYVIPVAIPIAAITQSDRDDLRNEIYYLRIKTSRINFEYFG